jgi:hypothetical protein
MKPHLVLLGKGLMAAGLTGVIGYLIGIATTHSPVWPWLFGLLGGLVAVGLVAYIAGQERHAILPGESGPVAIPAAAGIDEAGGSWFVGAEAVGQINGVEAVTEHQDPPGPAVTDRWRYTDGGPETAALQNRASGQPTHPGYMMRREEDKPPSLRVVIVMACSAPEGPIMSGTELRSAFIRFLASDTIMSLTNAVTFIEEGLTWTERPGHGRTLLEAAIVRHPDDDHEVPAAHAQLLLPEAGTHRYGTDGRRAELTLYIEPRGRDALPLPPADLAAWHRKLVKALDVPKALVSFLTSTLGLTTSSNPPALFGVLLRSRNPLTSMVSTAGLRMRPGASPSNWFYGYLIGDPDGETARAASCKLLTELCEYTLQADGYEDLIATLCQAELPMAKSHSDDIQHAAPIAVHIVDHRFENWQYIALIASLHVEVKNTTDRDFLVQSYDFTVENEGRTPWEHHVSGEDRLSIAREIERRMDRHEPGIPIRKYMRIPAHETISGWHWSAVTRIPTGGSPACTFIVKDDVGNRYQATIAKSEPKTYGA